MLVKSSLRYCAMLKRVSTFVLAEGWSTVANRKPCHAISPIFSQPIDGAVWTLAHN